MADQGFHTEFQTESEFSAFDAEDASSAFSAPEEAATLMISSSDDAELEHLRRELAEAKPRLDAFAQLEQLAEAQGTTPDAIAIQASIEVLNEEADVKRSEVERLQSEIDTAEADRQLVMDEHTAIVDQMAEMIHELESIRADAVRLLGEKATLEAKVEKLRAETDATAVAVHGERRSDSRAPIEADEDEAVAFDRFFEADVVEDKARAWMLEER